MSMRVLHVVPTYLPATRYGGPIYSVHGLARAQACQGDDVHVFTTNVDGPGVSPVPLREPVMLDGVKVWYFPCGAGRRLYRSTAMRRALTREVAGFDVLHLHSVFLWPTLVAAREASRVGVPYVLAPRGMLVADLIRRKSSLIKRLWIALFERRTVQAAAAAHVTSEIEVDEMTRLGLNVRKFAVVPNGIDLPALQSTAKIANKPYVLSLGRVNWKKGLDRLIAAMAHVPGADLVIAGNDEEGYRQTLDVLVAKHDLRERVSFVDHVVGDAKWALIQGAAVFSLPSYSENFGMAVLEAMACGVPVVVTPEVGLASTVSKVGAGIVVAGDAAPLGAAIAELLASPARRQEMGRAGRKAAEELFSWDAIAMQMKAVYVDARKSAALTTIAQR